MVITELATHLSISLDTTLLDGGENQPRRTVADSKDPTAQDDLLGP